MHEAQKFAWVLVPSSHREPLIYRVPAALLAKLSPGTRVMVPLQKRQVSGVVLSIVDESPHSEVKDLSEILDDQPIVDAELLKLAQWISQYYLVPLGDVVATILPPNSRRESQRLVILLKGDAVAVDEIEGEILHELSKRKGKVSLKALIRSLSGRRIARAVAKLEFRGVISQTEHLAKIRRRKVHLLSIPDPDIDAPATLKLNSQQALAMAPSRRESITVVLKPFCSTASPAAGRPKYTYEPWHTHANAAGAASF